MSRVSALLGFAAASIVATSCNRVVECPRVEAELHGALAAPGTCTTNTDCACYPGGTAATGCGGVATKAIASKLEVLTKEHVDKRCGGQVSCAAWLCTPVCSAGRCTAGAAPAPPPPAASP